MLRGFCLFIKVFTLITAISLLLAACNLWQGDFEEEVVIGEGYSLFSPDTILDDIAQGNNKVFFSILTTPEGTPNLPITVNWGQDSYFLVAKSFFTQTWSEPIENWDLDSMVFRLGCKDIGNGPQYGSFTFIKTGEGENKTFRKRRDIFIDPSGSTVNWIERVYTPNLAQPNPIDLTQVKINVEDALQIAELNGGARERVLAEDSCEIFLTLSPGSRYEGWQVGYSKSEDEGISTFFEAIINPISGELEVLTPHR